MKELINSEFLNNLRIEAENVAIEICDKAGLTAGQILVVGCSSSEISGESIGSCSSLEVAEPVFNGIHRIVREKGVFLAVQCCEHLNRAIIVEHEAVPNAEIVNVVPQPKAGGAFASIAYKTLKKPVVVEEIKADAGIDIGNTLIGMNLKKVAVPVRLVNDRIGETRVVAARVRPKFIGGERASYDEKLS